MFSYINFKKKPSLILLYYFLIIILLMLLPLNGGETGLNKHYVGTLRLDHFIHLLIFIIWSFLVWILKEVTFSKGMLFVIKWISISILFAVFAEVIQHFLPYRSFTLRDMLSNMMGAIIGVAFYFFNPETVRKKIFNWLHITMYN